LKDANNAAALEGAMKAAYPKPWLPLDIGSKRPPVK